MFHKGADHHYIEYTKYKIFRCSALYDSGRDSLQIFCGSATWLTATESRTMCRNIAWIDKDAEHRDINYNNAMERFMFVDEDGNKKYFGAIHRMILDRIVSK